MLSLFIFSSSIPDGDDEESPHVNIDHLHRRLVSVHVLRLFCQPSPAGLAVQLPACNRRVCGAYLWWVSLVNNTRYPQPIHRLESAVRSGFDHPLDIKICKYKCCSRFFLCIYFYFVIPIKFTLHSNFNTQQHFSLEIVRTFHKNYKESSST